MGVIVSRIEALTHPVDMRGAFTSAAAAAALGVVLYSKVMWGLVATWWSDPGASQGFLIPPLVLYVVSTRREEIRKTPSLSDGRGLWAVLLACIVFVLGSLGMGDFPGRVSLVIMVAGLIWTYSGLRRLRVLAFPLVLLATMIPIPAVVYGTVSSPLQMVASECSTAVAHFVGTAAYREGNHIYLAHADLGVADACSGLYSLSALLIAALLLGGSYYLNLPARVVLFLSSIPIAIGANVLRIAGTAVLADYQPALAMGVYHSFTGWLVFLVGLAALELSARFLRLLIRERK
jgi:exosortase